MENWKVIDECEKYEVSSLGRIRNKKTKAIRKQFIRTDGYAQIVLIDNNGKKRCFPVHRLVAQAFITNPSGFDTVNHIDHDPLNNAVDNLEWMSRSDNCANSPHPKGRWVKRQVRQLDKDRNIVAEYDSLGAAARAIGVPRPLTGINHIRLCLVNSNKSYYGYYWEEI